MTKLVRIPPPACPVLLVWLLGCVLYLSTAKETFVKDSSFVGMKRSRRAAPPPAEPAAALPAATEEDDDEEPERLQEERREEADEEEEACDAARDAALRTVPLGQLLAAKADGRADFRRSGARPPPRVPRANKNRPAVQSSKRPVPRLHAAPGLEPGAEKRAGGLLEAPYKPRDPRFDPAAAPADVLPAFRKRYKFIFDEALPAEKKRLKAAAARAKKPERKEALAAAASAADEALRREAAARAAEARAAARRGVEKAAVAGGKAPFYPKKADARKADLVTRYQELKAAGRLESFLAKRRAKLAAKDHVLVPGRREG